MQVIGLLGGMSWESSAEYYRIINQLVGERLGGLASARILMTSLDFAWFSRFQHEQRWDEAITVLVEEAHKLERAGADLLLICSNTTNIAQPAIEAALSIPVPHIIDPTALRIQAQGLTRIGLIGTSYTMELPFYVDRLRERHALEVIVPGPKDRAMIHRVIYEELCRGKVLPESRQGYLEAIERLVEAGAEGVILGCTEIPMLVTDGDGSVPLFDTTRIHCEAAVDMALAAD